MSLAKTLRLLALVAGSLAAAGCAPKPPPSGTAPSASPSATASAVPSGLETETPTPQPVAPIKARSEGTQGEPARYLVRNAKGRTIYDVRSQQALYDRSPDGSAVATFSNPDVTFHDRANRTMLATASQAIAHDKDKTVVMTGHVRATSGSEVLTCDELTYDGQRDALRGTGNVVLVNSKTHDVVTGGAISSDLSFEHVVLSSK